MSTREHPVDHWHRLVQTHDAGGLAALLDEDVVFHSPVAHTPQRGKAQTQWTLTAAFEVFFSGDFRYVREIRGERDCVLEFETTIDGILVNGVDLLRWSEDGRLVDFKVMIRPLKAIQLIHERMAAVLAPARAPR